MTRRPDTNVEVILGVEKLLDFHVAVTVELARYLRARESRCSGCGAPEAPAAKLAP